MSMENVKYIRDPLYGNIKVEGLFLELIETPEVQRLLGVKQLGCTYLVYPGANHTRFEHSLGVFQVAKKMCQTLDQPFDIVCTAALLHDIGHGPFSHTLEYLMHRRTKKDHVELAIEMIQGNRKLHDVTESEICCEVLERNGVDAGEVSSILNGNAKIASSIIHGNLDADQMDYLMRDAFYTGVAYGVIDVDRIIQTMKVAGGTIVFEKKGVSSLESMLLARALMYSSVYLHKTVRIAELMLARAVERASTFDFSHMNDCELIAKLRDMGPFQQDMITRLKYRKLFKRAYVKGRDELQGKEKEMHVSKDEIHEIEDTLAHAVGLDSGYVIVDIPGGDILLSEPRIKKMDVEITVDGDIQPLHHFTPLVDALERREITEWAIMICCPEQYRYDVAREAERILFI